MCDEASPSPICDETPNRYMLAPYGTANAIDGGFVMIDTLNKARFINRSCLFTGSKRFTSPFRAYGCMLRILWVTARQVKVFTLHQVRPANTIRPDLHATLHRGHNQRSTALASKTSQVTKMLQTMPEIFNLLRSVILIWRNSMYIEKRARLKLSLLMR